MPRGRPKGGAKFGGRQKGTPNKHKRPTKADLRDQRILQQAIDTVLEPEKASELTPLLVMRSVMQARPRLADRAAAGVVLRP